MNTFKKGQKVEIIVKGAGVTTYEEGVVLSEKDGEVLLDNGPGNDPGGPYDARTGLYKDVMPGFSMRIQPQGEAK